MRFLTVILVGLLILCIGEEWVAVGYRISRSAQAINHHKKVVSKLLATNTFSGYGFPDWLVRNCGRLGFNIPTAVQELALPKIMAGQDVVLQARTGSGKTLTYALPLISKLDPSRSSIQAIIVVPTRELGLQVTSVIKQLITGSPTPISIMTVVEGSKNRRQILWATAEPPHIVVGNPTSLHRLVQAGKLRLNAVDLVVVDEVDACLIEHTTRQELHELLSRHLSSTFTSTEEALQEDIRESRVYRDLAKNQESSMGLGKKYQQERQTIMCSATIPQRQHFAVNCFKNGWTANPPEIINASKDELVPTQVSHEHIHCPMELRDACLNYIIKTELVSAQAISDSDAVINDPLAEEEQVQLPQAIVFIDDINSIKRIEILLETTLLGLIRGVSGEGGLRKQRNNVGVLLESMSLDARAKILRDFRCGKLAVLVCSDLGTRGLDLPNTAVVVQWSLPDRVEKYIHRSGRTGRLNRAGKVITLTAPEEDFVIKRYCNEIGVPIHTRKLRVKTH